MVTMQRDRQISPGIWRGASRLALAAALGTGACVGGFAWAQDATGLRGALIAQQTRAGYSQQGDQQQQQRNRPATAQSPLDRTAQPGRMERPSERRDPLSPRQQRVPLEQQGPLPPYEPVSPGAVPDRAPANTTARDDVPTDRLLGDVPGAANATPAAPAQAARREQTRRETTNRRQQEATERAQRRTNLARQDNAAPTPPQRQADQRQADPRLAARRDADGTPVGRNTRAVRLDTSDLERNARLPSDAERAYPVDGSGPAREQNPYRALGVTVGTFTLRPTLEQGIDITSNADNTSGGSADVLSESTLRLNAASNWSRHSAALDGYGTFRKSLKGTGFQEFRGAINGEVKLELGNEFALTGKAGYQRRPEDASSPIDLTATAGRPTRQTLTTSLGLEKELGKARLGLTGNIERNIYGDAPLSNGGSLSQVERNQTLYNVALRGGYQISPALTPFIEAQLGRRIYDLATDASGYARSANRTALRGGVEFDMGEKLRGELAAGWLREKADDTRLASVSGLSLDGSVIWSPMRSTLVSLTGTTEVEGSVIPGAPGSLLYSTGLTVSRELRANLTGTASLGAAWRNYTGTTNRDVTLSAEAGATWWFNRYAGVKGRLRHEQTQSTIAGRGSQSNSIFLGVVMQR